MSQETRLSTNGRAAEKRWAAPPVDVYENADEVLLVADVPGITEDGLSIELDRTELRIVGQRYHEEHGKAVQNGVARFDWRRAFTVPDGIDPAAVRAELKNGVLYVHLPKAPDVKPRKIAVKAA